MTTDIRTLRPGQVAGFLTPQNADKSGAERQQAEQGGKSRKHCCARPVAKPVATPGVEPTGQHQDAEKQPEKTDEACDVDVLHTSSTSPLSPLNGPRAWKLRSRTWINGGASPCQALTSLPQEASRQEGWLMKARYSLRSLALSATIRRLIRWNLGSPRSVANVGSSAGFM